MVEFQKRINDTFASSDEDNKGYLTKGDYKVAIIQLFGYKPSKHEVLNAWRGKSVVEDGISLKDFTDIVLPRLQKQDPSERARQTFMAFDRFCHGFISFEDCKAAFAKVAPLMPEARVKSFFQEIDADLDGRVSYRDFELMFKNILL